MSFARPTLQQLIDRQLQDVQTSLEIGPVQPHTVIEALCAANAKGTHGFYGNLDWLARQILPDTADPDVLERWARDEGIFRKPAEFASGSVVFTGTNGSAIPAGTIAKRADGGSYTTDAAAAISSGTATVAVSAQQAGAIGNAPAAAALALVTTIPGVNGTLAVDSNGITGGADPETDAELLARLLQKLQTPPEGSAASDYVKWALQQPGVTRAWAIPTYPGLGSVGVAFARDDDDDGPIPDVDEVQLVQDALDLLRPVTAEVVVFAPGVLFLNPSIQISPNTAAVQAAITASLEDLLQAEAAPGSVLLRSHIQEAISAADGEFDNVLILPAANVAPAAGTIVLLGTITFASIP